MTFEIVCTCGQKLIAQEKHIGKQTKCPRCHEALVVPNPESSEDNELSNQTDEDETGTAFADPSEIAVMNPYVAALRKRFEKALVRIDDEVPKLISKNLIMAACEVFSEIVREISIVHDTLECTHELIISSREVLQHFGLSDRLSEEVGFAVHPISIRDFEREDMRVARQEHIEALRSLNISGSNIDPDFWYELQFNDRELGKRDDDDNERYDRRFGERICMPVVAHKHRLIRAHPLLKTMRLTEIEYMLRVLEALAEPDWVPGKGRTSDRPPSVSATSDSEISQEIRMAVWHRDKGRCAECSARDDVELTFIIPPSQGGALNEHNSRLLCTKCRVKQGARA